MNKTSVLFLASIAATIVAGCSDDQPPAQTRAFEVNDENCASENLLAIKDKTAQQKLADACARRTNFKKSDEKTLTW
ncbi:MAG: entry exclusion lipoprotein TrbK [Azoarcus sp.]|jgi:entry exclusion lipoprotein TrbK|nr:entry exclusion lipoprotein TrbK [Azoarcus sp.]